MEARCAPSNGLPLKEQGSHETFTEHMTSENEEKPFSCNECDNKCSDKSNLKVHMRRHGDLTVLRYVHSSGGGGRAMWGLSCVRFKQNISDLDKQEYHADCQINIKVEEKSNINNSAEDVSIFLISKMSDYECLIIIRITLIIYIYNLSTWIRNWSCC